MQNTTCVSVHAQIMLLLKNKKTMCKIIFISSQTDLYNINFTFHQVHRCIRFLRTIDQSDMTSKFASECTVLSINLIPGIEKIHKRLH